MSDFNKDDYLKDLPDVDSLDGEKTSDKAGEASHNDTQQTPATGAASQPDAAASPKTTTDQPAAGEQQDKAAPEANDAEHDKDGSLTPLGQAKKEAAEYLEALQRERAEFARTLPDRRAHCQRRGGARAWRAGCGVRRQSCVAGGARGEYRGSRCGRFT